ARRALRSDVDGRLTACASTAWEVDLELRQPERTAGETVVSRGSRDGKTLFRVSAGLAVGRTERAADAIALRPHVHFERKTRVRQGPFKDGEIGVHERHRCAFENATGKGRHCDVAAKRRVAKRSHCIDAERCE